MVSERQFESIVGLHVECWLKLNFVKQAMQRKPIHPSPPSFKLLILLLLLLLLIGCKSETGPDSNGAARPKMERELMSAVSGNDAVELSEPTRSDLSTQQLYQVYCYACHGETGDADGPGAQTVYPLPRSFRTDRFKMVGAKNRLPDVEDFKTVIANGMPGSSMPAFPQVHPDDQTRLAEFVLELWRAGVRDELLAESIEEGEELDGKTLDELVLKLTTADEKVAVPEFASATKESIQRGLELYKTQSCAACHGEDYRGSETVDLVDEHGQSIRPRDLENEPYKCGDADASIFLRLRLGIPGTPHPSNDAMSDDQLVDLVNALQSVRADQTVALTGFQRRSAITVRDYLRLLESYHRQ